MMEYDSTKYLIKKKVIFRAGISVQASIHELLSVWLFPVVPFTNKN